MSNRDPERSYSRLSQAVTFAIAQALKDLHTVNLGLVRAYDPATKRARVQVASRILETDGSERSRPVIVDVPVRQTATGGFLVHHPVVAGDVVLLVFAERRIERFKAAWGREFTPTDDAVFAEGDALAIPWGVESIAPVTAEGWVAQSADGSVHVRLDEDRAVIKVGDNRILVTADQVVIEVQDGQNVHVGGTNGQPLATETFVEDYYREHVHSTPAGPSGPPLVRAPLRAGADITDKARAEMTVVTEELLEELKAEGAPASTIEVLRKRMTDEGGSRTIEAADFEIAEQGSLEHSVVVKSGNPGLHVVGRWFSESEGDFRGMAFDSIEDAKRARKALRAAFRSR